MVELPLQAEEWKPIDVWDGYYISNFGNVKRRRRGVKDQFIMIKGSVTNRGYKYIQQRQDDKRINHLVHRLVAKAFIENADNKECVDHIDNNSLNNHYLNLRWCHHFENCKNQKQKVEGKKNGVRIEKKTQRWIAEIRINNKSKFLGYFDTYDEARNARENAEQKEEGKDFYKTGSDKNFSDQQGRPKSKRGQGEGCIHQRKNGNWRAKFQDKGITIFDKTFKTRDEANEYRINKIKDYNDGR